MYILQYIRKDVGTENEIVFQHRCMSEAVLEHALLDYMDIDLNKYAKRDLSVVWYS